MYALYDRSNCRIISCHRTPEAVARADRRYQRAVQRANGSASYIPTTIVRLVRGEIVSASVRDRAIFVFAKR